MFLRSDLVREKSTIKFLLPAKKASSRNFIKDIDKFKIKIFSVSSSIYTPISTLEKSAGTPLECLKIVCRCTTTNAPGDPKISIKISRRFGVLWFTREYEWGSIRDETRLIEMMIIIIIFRNTHVWVQAKVSSVIPAATLPRVGDDNGRWFCFRIRINLSSENAEGWKRKINLEVAQHLYYLFKYDRVLQIFLPTLRLLCKRGVLRLCKVEF